MIKRRLLLRAHLYLVCCIAILPNPIYGSDCSQRAITILEKAYCKVKAEGLGKHLPPFQQFKENTPVVQRLLLKRDAKKLGIDLPSTDRKKVTKNKKRPKSDPGVGNKKTDKVKKMSVKVKPDLNDSASKQKSKDLAGLCKLLGKSIQCEDKRFKLLLNINNKYLDQDVFSEENQLILPEFKGNAAHDEEVAAYLYKAYPIYIEKMLALGLAEATMTYTKFHRTFYHADESGVDFAGRFKRMYQYLKKDKMTISVSSNKNINMPKSLAFCSSVNEKIIVCDRGQTNLVFTLQP